MKGCAQRNPFTVGKIYYTSYLEPETASYDQQVSA